jgi:DNA-binding CsgD family transcriptional regulator
MLHISVHTVKAHLEAIYDKLGVSNRVQAAIKAVKLELINIKKLV